MEVALEWAVTPGVRPFLRYSLALVRQSKKEHCAVVGLRPRPDAAAVAFDDALDVREANARAFILSGRMHALEGLK